MSRPVLHYATATGLYTAEDFSGPPPMPYTEVYLAKDVNKQAPLSDIPAVGIRPDIPFGSPGVTRHATTDLLTAAKAALELLEHPTAKIGHGSGDWQGHTTDQLRKAIAAAASKRQATESELVRAVSALLDSPDLDQGGTITAETVALRQTVTELLERTQRQPLHLENEEMRKDFAAIGALAIEAFNADSGDEEASALKQCLDIARTHAPELPPDSENWAI